MSPRATPLVRLWLGALVIACGSHEGHDIRHDFDASVSPRATLLLAPRVLHIGEIVTAEIVVVTPPESRVRSAPPQQIEGLVLLGAQTLDPERSEHHWTHRSRYRLRANSVGKHVWPTLVLEVERPNGTLEPIAVSERNFEVVSVSGLFPDRDQPFGLEEPDAASEAADSAGFVAGLALGVLLSALLALGACGVRAALGRRAENRVTREAPPAVPLFEWTDRQLAEAGSLLSADPGRAAAVGARLLRVYMARRFGSKTEAATTEELERHTPALAEQSPWPDFVRILHSFDAQRFRPTAKNSSGAEEARVRSALEDSQRLIEASQPAPAAEKA